MIQYSDFKRATDIYIEFLKLEPLFDSVDSPTRTFIEREQERHPFSSRKIINKILKLATPTLSVKLLEGRLSIR